MDFAMGNSNFTWIIIMAVMLPLVGAAAATETVLYSFQGGSDGANPRLGSLIEDSGGTLYGTTDDGGLANCGTVFKLTPPASGVGAWSESQLYALKGAPDGCYAYAGVLRDSAGALYSTTSYGGSGNGVVFKVTPPPKG
jgi:uncharacterized repeat protein (TIGR03803 family)